MEKLITIVLLFVAMQTSAQQAIEQPVKPIQNLTTKQKAGKTLVVASGAAILLGSIVYYNTVSSAPAANASQQKIDSFAAQQKSGRKTAALIYGFGGLALAVGAAITF